MKEQEDPGHDFEEVGVPDRIPEPEDEDGVEDPPGDEDDGYTEGVNS